MNSCKALRSGAVSLFILFAVVGVFGVFFFLGQRIVEAITVHALNGKGML